MESYTPIKNKNSNAAEKRLIKMIVLGFIAVIFLGITFHNCNGDETQSVFTVPTDDEENSQQTQVSEQTKKQEEAKRQKKYELLRDKYKQKMDLTYTLYNRLQTTVRNIQQPQEYHNISSVASFKQLPFCILSSSTSTITSLENQNYTNYHVMYFASQQLIKGSKVKWIKEENNLISLSDKLIHEDCGSSSIIFITNEPLKQNALVQLNNVYQKYNIWLTYDAKSDDDVSISSFIGHVFHRLKSNDFKKKKQNLIGQNMNFVVLSMLQLGKYRSYKVQTETIFHKAFFHVKLGQKLFENIQKIEPYQPLFTLSQTYRFSEREYKNYYESMMANKDKKGRYVAWRQITQPQMILGIQYLELKSLPLNHSLFDRQKVYYQSKYNVNKYPQQIPICIVVPSYNNLDNERYKKAMHTVLYQDYKNYHIVLIDDASTDKTLIKTQQYLESHGFDMKRFNGIKNPHKMYATYNLQNAAHNYCHEQDIYLILDGDDELVGHQVFKLLNAKYQEKDNWIVYTSYFSSKFSYGNSQRVHRDFFEGKRVRAHIMGPVRTYYNSLYKKIDNKQHKDKFGQYLKTAYDEAMQFPLFEMAGFDRIEYVRQLCYFYNMYQNNDGKNGLSIDYRNKLIDNDLMRRPRYTKLQKLFQQ